MEMVQGFSELSLEEMEMTDGGAWWQTLLNCIVAAIPPICKVVTDSVEPKIAGIVTSTLGAISNGITGIMSALEA